MAVKYQIDTTEYETLDESRKSDYIEKDGAYILHLENDDVSKTLEALKKERELVKAKEKQLKELMASTNKKDDLNTPPAINQDKPTAKTSDEEIITKQVKAKTFELERSLTEKDSALNEALSQLKELKAKEKNILLSEKLSSIITKHQEIEPSSLKFLQKLGISELNYDEDRKDFVNDTYYSLGDWVNAQLAEYPQLIKPSFSAGAKGGKHGVKTIPTLNDQINNMFKN